MIDLSRLRGLREKAGLTRRDLADRIGCRKTLNSTLRRLVFIFTLKIKIAKQKRPNTNRSTEEPVKISGLIILAI
ncbi:unnamed protein product [marine sediment metagenome]|uniref:HTH cro/C1-type domain-containing protein n=1 Tax=marine sediment metagenome TaxID=412755 RepID=X1IEI1_9ZZZZ